MAEGRRTEEISTLDTTIKPVQQNSTQIEMYLCHDIHETKDCGQNKLVWRCHQLLSRLLVNGHLPRVSRQSANDKDDNEMLSGPVYRSPGSSYSLQMEPVGSLRKGEEKKERKKERKKEWGNLD